MSSCAASLRKKRVATVAMVQSAIALPVEPRPAVLTIRTVPRTVPDIAIAGRFDAPRPVGRFSLPPARYRRVITKRTSPTIVTVQAATAT
jgi:hypothetical protein